MARIRGNMKRPFRISQQKPKKTRLQKELEKIDLLGDDELKTLNTLKTKKVVRSIVKDVDADNKSKIESQKQNYLKKMLQQKENERNLLKNAIHQQKKPIEDPWSADVKPFSLHTNLPPIKHDQICNYSHINSIHSYNPDKRILSDAQKQVAYEHLNSQLQDLQKQLNSSKSRRMVNYRRLSEEAFLQLNGEQQFRIVETQSQQDFDLQRQQLLYKFEELNKEISQFTPQQLLLNDDLIKRRNQLQQYVEQLQSEVDQLVQMYNNHLNEFEENKRNLPITTTAQREQAKLFADTLLDLQTMINQNQELIFSLQKEMQHFSKDTKYDIQLPLESEVGNLRQLKPISSIDELYTSLQNRGKFGSLAETTVLDHYNDNKQKQIVVREKSSVKVRKHSENDKKLQQAVVAQK